jgi:hypothetical protein
MGDGYCRHCDDKDQVIPVERDFLLTLLYHVDQGMLSHLQDSLHEDIRGSCDYCHGEVARELLDLVLKAKADNRSQHPRIVISIS